MGTRLVPTDSAASVSASVRPLPPPHEPQPHRSPGSGRGWVAIVAGVVGLAIGLLVASPSGKGESGSGPFARLTGAEHVAGINSALPGFGDVLLAVGTDGTRPMELTSWPPAGAVDRLALPASWTAVTFADGPFGDFARFDASGRQVALGAPLARDGTVTLLAGRPEAVVVVATGVTSYAWHSSRPHSLAYVVEDPSGRWLEVMSGSPLIVERIGPVEPSREIVAWVTAGFVMRGPNDLAVTGEGPQQRFEGRYLDGAGGSVLVERATELGYVDAATGDYRGTGIPSGVTAARFDPGQNRVALARPTAVEVWQVNGGVLLEAEVANVARLAWSSDGRFLIMADRVDTLVLDTTDGTLTALGLGPTIAVATRPLDLIPAGFSAES